MDAVQGRAEQRSELYRKIQRTSSGGSNEVMRHKRLAMLAASLAGRLIAVQSLGVEVDQKGD
ncbi:hypothetical protein HYS84_00450 [Candidatus Saccharibacteria bacterium]|nr:hypothetical protein [Candidatus Saccharibacteria bacterium]